MKLLSMISSLTLSVLVNVVGCYKLYKFLECLEFPGLRWSHLLCAVVTRCAVITSVQVHDLLFATAWEIPGDQGLGLQDFMTLIL